MGGMPVDSRYGQQFKKGALELVLLCLIARGETYGYEILTALDRQGGRIFGGAREGSVYPVLYRLEETGLISSRIRAEGGRSRKYYAITPAGQAALTERTAFWRSFSQCVDGFLQDEEDAR